MLPPRPMPPPVTVAFFVGVCLGLVLGLSSMRASADTFEFTTLSDFTPPFTDGLTGWEHFYYKLDFVCTAPGVISAQIDGHTVVSGGRSGSSCAFVDSGGAFGTYPFVVRTWDCGSGVAVVPDEYGSSCDGGSTDSMHVPTLGAEVDGGGGGDEDPPPEEGTEGDYALLVMASFGVFFLSYLAGGLR